MTIIRKPPPTSKIVVYISIAVFYFLSDLLLNQVLQNPIVSDLNPLPQPSFGWKLSGIIALTFFFEYFFNRFVQLNYDVQTMLEWFGKSAWYGALLGGLMFVPRFFFIASAYEVPPVSDIILEGVLRVGQIAITGLGAGVAYWFFAREKPSN